MQDWMQVADVAGDINIVTSNYHVTRMPLKSFGPEVRISVTPDTISILSRMNLDL